MKFVFRMVKIPEDISSLKHQIKFDRAPQTVKTIPINEQTMQIPCSLNFITRHLCSINYSNDLQQISYNYSPILVFPYNSCVGSRLQHDIFFDERYLDFNNLSKIDGRRDFWDGNRGEIDHILGASWFSIRYINCSGNAVQNRSRTRVFSPARRWSEMVNDSMDATQPRLGRDWE